MRILFYFLMIWHECYTILKAFIMFFIDRIFCCFFYFYLIRKIYLWSTTICNYFTNFIIQQMKLLKTKSLPFIDFPKLFWYLLRGDWKSSSMTSSVSSLIVILSLFECNKHSSSLLSYTKIKLIVIVISFFNGSDFLKLFMILCKYGLILKRYFLTNSVFLSHLLLYSV